MSTVDQMLAQFRSSGGTARGNRYRIILDRGDGDKLNILCDSVTLPGRQIATSDYMTTMKSYKKPYAFLNEDVTVSFILTNDWYSWNYLKTWQSLVINDIDEQLGVYTVNTKDIYTRQVTIEHLNQNDEVTKVITLYAAYPTSLSSMELSNSNENQVLRCTAVLSYDNWKEETLFSRREQILELPRKSESFNIKGADQFLPIKTDPFKNQTPEQRLPRKSESFINQPAEQFLPRQFSPFEYELGFDTRNLPQNNQAFINQPDFISLPVVESFSNSRISSIQLPLNDTQFERFANFENLPPREFGLSNNSSIIENSLPRRDDSFTGQRIPISLPRANDAFENAGASLELPRPIVPSAVTRFNLPTVTPVLQPPPPVGPFQNPANITNLPGLEPSPTRLFDASSLPTLTNQQPGTINTSELPGLEPPPARLFDATSLPTLANQQLGTINTSELPGLAPTITGKIDLKTLPTITAPVSKDSKIDNLPNANPVNFNIK